MIKVKTRILLSITTEEILLNINSPSQELKGPGKTGIMLPIIPIIIIKKDNISKNISIIYLKEF